MPRYTSFAEAQAGEAAKKPEAQLNQFNQNLRANPDYVNYLRSIGVNTDQAWGLSDQQRKQAESWVQQRYGDLGKRMEIDRAGNVNQNEGFGPQARRWGPIIGAGIATAATAGGASPLLAAAIGGGIGGATGALDEGGWRGGLQGAAVGAAPAAAKGFTSGWSAPSTSASLANTSNLTAGLTRAVPANIASQGASQGYALPTAVAAGGGGGAGVGGIASRGIGLPGGTFTGPSTSTASTATTTAPAGSTFNQLVGARSIPAASGSYGGPANIVSQNLTGGGSSMGWLDWLKKGKDYYDKGKGAYDMYRDIASTYGAGANQASQAMATNRGEKLSAQMDLERLMMDRDRDFLTRQILRETEGRASASDAYKKMLLTQRALSPSPRPNADNPYNAAPRVLTADERAGNTALSAEVMKRLTGGNPIPLQVLRALEIDKSLMDPSNAESILGYTGAAARAYGTRNRPIYVQSANDYATNYR